MRKFFGSLLVLSAFVCRGATLEPPTEAERIPPGQIKDGSASLIPFNDQECEQSYFQIKVTRFDIGYDHRGWKDYTPVLKVTVSANGGTVAKMIDTGTDANNDGHYRSQENVTVIGPMPYKGGSVTVGVKLYGVAIKNHLTDAFAAANDVANLLGKDINTYTTLAKPVVGFVEGLFKMDDLKTGVSYLREWDQFNPDKPAGNAFQSGYYVMHASSATIDLNAVEINEDGQFTFLRNPANVDYVVIQFMHGLQRAPKQGSKFQTMLDQAMRDLARGKKPSDVQEGVRDALFLLDDDPNYTITDKTLTRLAAYNEFTNQAALVDPKFRASPLLLISSCYGQIDPKKTSEVIRTRAALIETGRLKPGQVVSEQELNNKFEDLSNEMRSHSGDAAIKNLLDRAQRLK